ncbi:hypothetical protein [Streptomyces murinus]|uniref:Succinate dehydrogenase/fumarate reductase flavoprotein subunit n=1 Tax=Streptomyces murinus TaxID=33900 RepID=A0A7W3NVM9_STRMR|nr:hypothetical protein [Streptomyces murinus]MBA9057566.1 succinate dehydrogenase/fumarate reductase flavoprotein subunit [Streptomyces murinus]
MWSTAFRATDLADAAGAVARRADVSRAFLDENLDAKAAVATAMTEAGERRSQLLTDYDSECEAPWPVRALNASDALKAAHADILAQRTRIGELPGEIGDLQVEWIEEAIQRITSENTTLKQRVRRLTAANRTLDEHFKATRSNLRFLDRRVADLQCRRTRECASEVRTNVLSEMTGCSLGSSGIVAR